MRIKLYVRLNPLHVFHRKWLFLLLVLSSITCFAQDTRVGDNYALVIIDMHPKFVKFGGNDKNPANIKKIEDILDNQIKLIKAAKKQKIPIIFIEYEGWGGTDTRLKKAAVFGEIKFFTKNTDGMLDNFNRHRAELSQYLRSKEIGNLIITGANGGACVENSIIGSLKYNYNVIAFSKGIADFNYPEFIYPYDNKYKFKPSCESCSFREIDEFEEIVLELETKTDKSNKSVGDQLILDFFKKIGQLKTSLKVNESDRSSGKDVPISGKKKTSKPAAGASEQ